MRRPIACLASFLAVAAPTSALANELPGEGFRNHLMISLGFGYGSLAMGQENAYVAADNQSLQSQGFTIQGAANVGGEIHGALALTYYGPYWTLLRVGLEASFFQPTENGTFQGQQQTITNYGGTAEVPILIGGHYALLDNRLILEIAVGPDITFETQTGLNSNNLPNAVRLSAGTTVGFDSELGIHYLLSHVFGVGLELGYRSLVSPPLSIADGPTTPFISPTGSTVNLDFTGFHFLINIAFVVI